MKSLVLVLFVGAVYAAPQFQPTGAPVQAVLLQGSPQYAYAQPGSPQYAYAQSGSPQYAYAQPGSQIPSGAQVIYIQPQPQYAYYGGGLPQGPQVAYIQGPTTPTPIKVAQQPYKPIVAPPPPKYTPVAVNHVPPPAPLAPKYAPQPVPVPGYVILKQTQNDNYDGSFDYSYETDHGIKVDVQGYLKNAGTENEAQVIQGSYSYYAPDGTPILVTYTADENGFVAQGDHLPQPHPAIAKALEYQRSLPPSQENQKKN